MVDSFLESLPLFFWIVKDSSKNGVSNDDLRLGVFKNKKKYFFF